MRPVCQRSACPRATPVTSFPAARATPAKPGVPVISASLSEADPAVHDSFHGGPLKTAMNRSAHRGTSSPWTSTIASAGPAVIRQAWHYPGQRALRLSAGAARALSRKHCRSITRWRRTGASPGGPRATRVTTSGQRAVDPAQCP